MLSLTNHIASLSPSLLFGKKNGDVDTGTTRKTPGDSGGARPPKKKDFEEIEEENERHDEPQGETVDNEEKDKNTK
ncbi:hypothetical protein SYJ56_13925 [Algoriphagus sp. D3-2-R+10]|uniref:hypothetical protein n=1 Tax=Algoriphagus aurantiacus TaxID=3103948 RepID=UPI002B3A8DF2|nr:hypothetical protein [Algoriphagus sp. D3-2-R+10]MEB2776416.1 hypothetical protein [Algoriphagus sp. D3-2-R+10]